mmetsp:Transcript_80053/g.173025  ORF Transcript_80053/g.173025 Transcript_80053/m.173025 type:complete len:599 (+) Transcript_80053:383-2179(+)
MLKRRPAPRSVGSAAARKQQRAWRQAWSSPFGRSPGDRGPPGDWGKKASEGCGRLALVAGLPLRGLLEGVERLPEGAQLLEPGARAALQLVAEGWLRADAGVEPEVRLHGLVRAGVGLRALLGLLGPVWAPHEGRLRHEGRQGRAQAGGRLAAQVRQVALELPGCEPVEVPRPVGGQPRQTPELRRRAARLELRPLRAVHAALHASGAAERLQQTALEAAVVPERARHHELALRPLELGAAGGAAGGVADQELHSAGRELLQVVAEQQHEQQVPEQAGEGGAEVGRAQVSELTPVLARAQRHALRAAAQVLELDRELVEPVPGQQARRSAKALSQPPEAAAAAAGARLQDHELLQHGRPRRVARLPRLPSRAPPPDPARERETRLPPPRLGPAPREAAMQPPREAPAPLRRLLHLRGSPGLGRRGQREQRLAQQGRGEPAPEGEVQEAGQREQEGLQEGAPPAGRPRRRGQPAEQRDAAQPPEAAAEPPPGGLGEAVQRQGSHGEQEVQEGLRLGGDEALLQERGERPLGQQGDDPLVSRPLPAAERGQAEGEGGGRRGGQRKGCEMRGAQERLAGRDPCAPSVRSAPPRDQHGHHGR